MSQKSRVELGDTSSGSVLGLVPLEIRVDKVDEPLIQAQIQFLYFPGMRSLC